MHNQAEPPAFNLSCQEDGPILRISIAGQASAANADEIARQTQALIHEHPQRLIAIDVRAIKGRLGVFETYAHVRDKDPSVPRRRTAVIENSANREQYSFFETTSINRGLNLRVFTDPAAAEAWLLAGYKP